MRRGDEGIESEAHSSVDGYSADDEISTRSLSPFSLRHPSLAFVLVIHRDLLIKTVLRWPCKQ